MVKKGGAAANLPKPRRQPTSNGKLLPRRILCRVTPSAFLSVIDPIRRPELGSIFGAISHVRGQLRRLHRFLTTRRRTESAEARRCKLFPTFRVGALFYDKGASFCAPVSLIFALRFQIGVIALPLLRRPSNPTAFGRACESTAQDTRNFSPQTMHGLMTGR
jgi:hypothetical protein